MATKEMKEEKGTKRNQKEPDVGVTIAAPKADAPKPSEARLGPANRSSLGNCTDRKCVLHGGLPARGRVFEGIVLSDKMQKTVTVEWPRLFYIPKFERYEKRRSKVHAHNPACISAKTGERVRIVETRPLTKTVKFAVVEKFTK